MRRFGASLAANPGRWLRRILLTVVGLLVLAAIIFTIVGRLNQPAAPNAFYTPPAPLPSGPLGTVIRSEPLTNLPDTVHGWRILYLSTDPAGKHAAVSGLLFVPTTPAPAGGRNVVVNAHGTTGVARNCAVSLLGGDYSLYINGFAAFMQAGDAVVATDYEGLGAPGTMAYLIGQYEAYNVLDSVRAAHLFAPAEASTNYVVTGQSQGGQAALFTGEYAAQYAPDLHLLGVAATAPPSDLAQLFAAGIGKPAGNILAAYSLTQWSQVYPQLALDQIVKPVARPVIRNISTYCLLDAGHLIAIAPQALALNVVFLSNAPWQTEPWKTELAQNSLGNMPIHEPLFIGQGSADLLVLPTVTAAYVQHLCTTGERVAFTSYPDADHNGVESAATNDVTAWVADRFADKPSPSTCG